MFTGEREQHNAPVMNAVYKPSSVYPVDPNLCAIDDKFGPEGYFVVEVASTMDILMTSFELDVYLRVDLTLCERSSPLLRGVDANTIVSTVFVILWVCVSSPVLKLLNTDAVENSISNFHRDSNS